MYTQLIDQEQLIFIRRFFSFFAVTLQDKLGDGVVEPRSLEAEGIFVGKKPVVPTNVVHRAEKRIVEECVVTNKVIQQQYLHSFSENKPWIILAH